MTAEGDLMRRIQIRASKLGARLFRNNVAQAWVGKVVRQTSDTITLRNYRPLHAGLCVGSSDLIGWTPVVVTPDMVGKTVALFTAVEVKTPRGSASDEQRNFVDAVISTGGRAGVAREEKDLTDILCVEPFADQSVAVLDEIRNTPRSSAMIGEE